MQQLLLPIFAHNIQTFDNFYVIRRHQQLIYLLNRSQYTENTHDFCQVIYAHAAYGKTHILQAVYSQATQLNSTVTGVYVDCCSLSKYDYGLLSSLSEYNIICLDNIEKIIGEKDWEEEIFYIYNNMQNNTEQKHRLLLISTHIPKDKLPFILPDLASRFAQAINFQLHNFADEEQVHALKYRFNYLQLDDNLLIYLVNHYSRNMHMLYNLIVEADKQAKTTNKKLNLNFIKLLLK